MMGFIKKSIRPFQPFFFRMFLFFLKIRNKKKFLILWNRGLGDIALGLYGLNQRIKEIIPDASISYLTRKDLKEGFDLLQGCEVIVDPNMERKMPYNVSIKLRKQYDVIIEKPDPTYWLLDQLSRLVPNLTLPAQPIKKDRQIALHVSTETGQFYGYNKNWPEKNFRELILKLNQQGIKPILIGLQKNEVFNDLMVEDLRGEKGLIEILKEILENCQTLIAPDSGILSLVYYLNHPIELNLISFWSDPNQGILKQNVPSPNPLLQHHYFIKNDLSKLSCETIFPFIQTGSSDAIKISSQR